MSAAFQSVMSSGSVRVEERTMNCPECEKEIKPYNINGEPSINHKGERLYFCECRNYVESELSNTARAERPKETAYSEPIRKRPGERRNSEHIAAPEGNRDFAFKPTQDESKMLSAIKARIRNGFSPTPDELRRDVGITLAKAKGILKKLREKNQIEWDEFSFRSIRIHEEKTV